MINPKAKLSFLIAAVLVLVTFVMVSCNDSSNKEETPAARTTDTVDTSKMDTASTRPVKTTN